MESTEGKEFYKTSVLLDAEHKEKLTALMRATEESMSELVAKGIDMIYEKVKEHARKTGNKEILELLELTERMVRLKAKKISIKELFEEETEKKEETERKKD